MTWKQKIEHKLAVLKWFYMTRLLGTIIVLYGVFGDHSTDRGTIILTGAGLLGIDRVTKAESKKEE